MEYDKVLKKLSGTSTIDRKEGLTDLIELIKGCCKNDQLNQSDKILKDKLKEGLIFQALGRLLRDPDWEIKRDSIESVMLILLKGVIDDDIDYFIDPIIQYIISCFSDSKTTVRKSAIQCLHEFWLKSRDLNHCLSSFADFGLNSAITISQRRDNNSALKLLLTQHFSTSDLSPLIDGVLKQLDIDSNDERLTIIVCDVLRSIKKIIGEDRFADYLKKSSSSINAFYNRCLPSLESRPNTNSTVLKNIIFSQRNSGIDSKLESNAFFLTAIPTTNNFQSAKLLTSINHNPDTFYLGFIPPSVIADIENNKKLEAIEEMHNLFNKLCREKKLDKLVPYLHQFIQLIQRLMEDQYLVVINSFKLLIDLVNSISQQEVDDHLDSLLQLLRMTLLYNMNNDAIIQKYVMSYSMILFRQCNTKQLLVKLCDQYFMMDLKQATVRQTSIDIIISALLKFPSNKFDLDFLTSKIALRLLDKKQKVKQAALECISVIGYIYGNGKMNTLLKIIEQSTKGDSTNSVAEIVQVKLSKHRLPHVDEDGLVVYVNDNDKNNNSRQYSIIDLENSSSDNSPISSANALEKRRPSAGKVRGRAKFPWDQNEGNCQNTGPFSMGPGITSLNQIQPSDAIPIQYSHGSLSVINKQMIHEGKTIRRLNELQYNNDQENNASLTRRSNSTDLDAPISTNTSGYSSNLSTSRRNTDSFIKQPNGNLTATNSSNVTPRNPPSRIEDNKLHEESPIPTKPTLGRSAGSRRKELDPSEQIPNSKNTHVVEMMDSYSGPIESTMLDSVRNSAAKKKALTIFNSSTQNSSLENSKSNKDINYQLTNGSKATESNINHKASEPVIAYNPYKGATFKPNPRYDGLIVGKSVSTPSIEVNEYNKTKQPVKGIHHPNIRSLSLAEMSDLTINEPERYDKMKSLNEPIDFPDNNEVSQNPPIKLNDIIEKNSQFMLNDNVLFVRPKIGRESFLTPRFPNVTSIGEEVLFSSVSSNQKFNIVGKSIFDNNTGNVSQRSVFNSQQNDNKRTLINVEPASSFNNILSHSEFPQQSKVTSKLINNAQKEMEFSQSIVGKSIVEKNGFEEESDEEFQKGIMSNTLRESLSIKRQKAASELNSSKQENTVLINTSSPHSAPGSVSHQAINKKPPMGGFHHNNTTPSSASNDRDMGYETLPPSRKPLRPALGNNTPKKIKPLSQTLPSPAPVDLSNISPAPLSNPDKSIAEFIHLVQNEDWEHKITALIIVQSLAEYHHETLTSRPADLHSICIAVCKECKNLRSQVAKCAIQTVGVLFTNLSKGMDPELDVIIINMLSKGGDASSIFLRQDVELTMSVMIENSTAQRAILPLITNGADNKNASIRKLVASNLMQITEKVGSVKILSCTKEITEKLLQVVGKFVMDSNQETRYYGKRILLELSKNPEFDKIAGKHLQSKDVKILNEAVENLRIRGVGDPPLLSQSASIRRSGPISRGSSAGNLVSLEQKSSSLSRGNSRSMSKLPISDLSSEDDDWLSKTCGDLGSSDFRLRQSALESLVNRQIAQKGLSKLLPALIPKLNDNNSKVTATALNVCRVILPSICSIFPSEFLSRFINTIALNFASNSAELKDSALILMDICFNNFDPNLLVQPCVEAINKANVKSKRSLIENMNALLHVIISINSSSSSRSYGIINRHLAPQIGLLIEQNRPIPIALRDCLQKLVLLSYEIVGPDIIESASRERSYSVKQIISDIIDNQHLSQ